MPVYDPSLKQSRVIGLPMALVFSIDFFNFISNFYLLISVYTAFRMPNTSVKLIPACSFVLAVLNENSEPHLRHVTANIFSLYFNFFSTSRNF